MTGEEAARKFDRIYETLKELGWKDTTDMLGRPSGYLTDLALQILKTDKETKEETK